MLGIRKKISVFVLGGVCGNLVYGLEEGVLRRRVGGVEWDWLIWRGGGWLNFYMVVVGNID